MKKFLLTLAIAALAAGSMNAQANTTNGNPEEPDRIQMRELSKNPTGLDVATGIDQVKVTDQKHECKGHKDGQACDKPADQQCDKCKAEAAKMHECKEGMNHECKKGEGPKHECKEGMNHECKKGEGPKHECKEGMNHECKGHKDGQACDKPADQQCDKCKAEADKKN